MKFYEVLEECKVSFDRFEREIERCKTLEDIQHVKNLQDSLLSQLIGIAWAIRHYENIEKEKKFLSDLHEWSRLAHKKIDCKESEIISNL